MMGTQMNRLKLNLMPSKPLARSPVVMEILSKTFCEHHIDILEKELNNSLRFKINFDQRKKFLEQEAKRFEQKAREPGRAREELILFRDMIKALRAEKTALSKDFLITITEDRVFIEANFSKKISEMCYFYLRIYFDKIISLIREAYAVAGENINFIEKPKNADL